MPQAEPFGCDRDLVRARLENLVQNRGKRHGKPFG
jgi:hypothetical protein